jgi:hypothetical protein
MALLKGLGGGGAMYAVNWGVEYIPVADMWRSVIFGTSGTLASLALAKWADPALGAATMGGTSALLIGRIVTQVRMASVAPSTSTGTTSSTGATGQGGAGVYRIGPRRDGGAVFRREGGAVYQNDAGAVATMRRPVFGPSFKAREAGASRFVPGPVRYFGPQSWAYDSAGRRPRVVSAHNR